MISDSLKRWITWVTNWLHNPTLRKDTIGISYEGTHATTPMIRFFDGPDEYGHEIDIGGGGSVVIGGGESSFNVHEFLKSSGYNPGSELTVITNDGEIWFYTNCQNGVASSSRSTLGNDGSLHVNGYRSVQLDHISGSTHAAALQACFNANKSKITRDTLQVGYSSAYGNGSLVLGYFLPGYDSSPYGGFFVCHYNNARYVGIQNGVYTQYELTKTASSSRRIKENIKAMTEEEARKLYDLNVISFDYKKEYEGGKKNQFGMIAEELNEVIPYAVYIPDDKEDTIWGIDYVKLIPHLIKCVQLQQKEIEELKKKIEEISRKDEQ